MGRSFSTVTSILLAKNNLKMEEKPFSAFLYFTIFYFSLKLLSRGVITAKAKDELKEEKMRQKYHSAFRKLAQI